MRDTIPLNHHSAVVLPYYFNEEGKPVFIFEKKSPKFKKPFFDNGLNFLGGNWQKGQHEDKSSLELISREINEEFWILSESEESYNVLLNQQFVKDEQEKLKIVYNQSHLRKMQEIGNFLKQGLKYCKTYIVTVESPPMKKRVKYANTVFSRELFLDETKKMTSLIADYGGKLTTDNLQWGGATVARSLEEINNQGSKFVWGYCLELNDLIMNRFVPGDDKTGVIRTIGDRFIKISSLASILGVEEKALADYSFADFERAGIEYTDALK